MPRPTFSDVHVNRPLTNISVAYMQAMSGFVSSRVFPTVPVPKQADRYFIYDRADFNRDEAQIRAPSTESAGGGYDLDNTPTYYCNVWSFHKDIDEQIRSNSDSPLNPDQDATRFVTQKLLIRKERDFATNFFTSSVWSYDYTGVSSSPTGTQFLQWNDASSTPIEDIRAGITDRQKTTGFRPNVLVFGREVFDTLVDHPDILDRIKYGQTAGGPAVATRDALAALWEVDEVLVMDAIYNTAAQGAAESSDFIGGKAAGAFYRPSSAGLMTPSAGYTFAWTGFVGSRDGMRIMRYPLQHLHSDRVEGELAIDHTLVSADLGAFWSSAVA